MNFSELSDLKKLGDAPFRIKSRSLKDHRLCINHKIALPIQYLSKSYDTSSDISIKKSDGTEIGRLCFTKELGVTNWRTLTEYQFIAFLNEASFLDRENDFSFQFDYLVIDDQFYQMYTSEYKESSSFWGGFIHFSPDNITSYNKYVSEIKLLDVVFPHDIYNENLIRAVFQPFAHERYLKFYHLLEMRFDVDVFNSIKLLDINNQPEKIGQILSDYSKTEIIRLKSIIENNVTDITSIVKLMNEIKHFSALAKEMFYKFGSKDSNPLKDVIQFDDLCVDGFEESKFLLYKVNYNKNYNKFIADLVSYWIYRIRCSIAHNKIGEYILAQKDEEFIVEFAEPLIKEIISQCFKK